MADGVYTEEELNNLKVIDLKKLSKKYNLSSTGTKVELITRLLECKNDTSTILQPGDEAKLLGDDVEDESTLASLDTGALDAVSADLLPASEERSLHVIEQHSLNDSKRPASPISADDFGSSAKVPKNLEDPEPVKSIEADKLTESERLAERATRFGLERPVGTGALSDDKLAARAKRFGIPIADKNVNNLRSNLLDSDPVDIDPEKIRKRAERFGETTNPTASKIESEERKASRQKRFGSTDDSLTAVSRLGTDEERKAARALKFGIQTSEEKLQSRKARFGLA